GGEGFGKSEVMGGMSEAGQVISQPLPEFGPCCILAVLCCRSTCCLLAIRGCELFARHVCQRGGQFRLFAHPLRQVIQRSLGLHWCAVKAQHKRQGRGSIAPLEEPVVYQGKERLAHIRCRQDTTLYREIVHSSFVSDVACPSQQSCGWRGSQVRCFPKLDDLCVTGMLLLPALLRGAKQARHKGKEAWHGERHLYRLRRRG